MHVQLIVPVDRFSTKAVYVRDIVNKEIHLLDPNKIGANEHEAMHFGTIIDLHCTMTKCIGTFYPRWK